MVSVTRGYQGLPAYIRTACRPTGGRLLCGQHLTTFGYILGGPKGCVSMSRNIFIKQNTPAKIKIIKMSISMSPPSPPQHSLLKRSHRAGGGLFSPLSVPGTVDEERCDSSESSRSIASRLDIYGNSSVTETEEVGSIEEADSQDSKSRESLVRSDILEASIHQSPNGLIESLLFQLPTYKTFIDQRLA